MNSGVVVVIPARFASTRLPGKPLITIADKPLIEWVYLRAAKIPEVNHILVATDHPEIEKAVSSFGGEVMMTPSELNSGSERVAWVAGKLDADIVINLQGDEPLISIEGVTEAIDFLKANREIPVATLGSPLKSREMWQHPSVVKVVVNAQGRALYFSRSAIPHFRDGIFKPLSNVMQHIGIYLFRRDFLLKYAGWPVVALEEAEKLEQMRILHFGYPMQVIKANQSSPGVDTPEDVEIVKSLLIQEGKVCDPESS